MLELLGDVLKRGKPPCVMEMDVDDPCRGRQRMTPVRTREPGVALCVLVSRGTGPVAADAGGS